MSSSFRLCLHKIVAALSIHCHHGNSTSKPPGAEQLAIGQRLGLTAALSNDRGAEWCHWKDTTEAQMCIKTGCQRSSADAPTQQERTVTLAVISLKERGQRLKCFTAVWSCCRCAFSTNVTNYPSLPSSWRLGGVWHKYTALYIITKPLKGKKEGFWKNSKLYLICVNIYKWIPQI